ncbi:MAG: M1 family metallopeptidase [Bacteroidia bacterium]
MKMSYLTGWIKLLSALLFLAGCTAESPTESAITDPHSYSHPQEVRVTHLDLDVVVDFNNEILQGTALLTIEKVQRNARQLYLDVKDMDIHSVLISSDGAEEKVAKFTLGEEDSILGQPLIIDLNSNTRFVSISYSTHPGAEALQFLSEDLTHDKEAKFLLTQSQAINARTWVPIQDSPGIRFTYNATVKVPDGMMAVMSASNVQEVMPGGVYTFEMNQPIPAYLLALAAGRFVFRAVGPRTGIYAEPGVIDDAAWEFEEMEKMMRIAEGLYGTYKWERYDLIVLPPSFPFGGMENPRITFATPTVITGDRSLVALVAHELAHSWSGNLVTNATWNDFWLNEGFTVYFENRIMEELYSPAYARMLAQISYEDLNDEVESFWPNDSLDTRLAIDLTGRNPDDGVTSIAYDKGFFFLKLLEEKVGRAAFDKFINQYFEENAFQTMTTAQFVHYLRENLLNQFPGAEEEIQLSEWIYGTGIPENIPHHPSEKFKAVEDQVAAWIAGISPVKLTTEGWTAHEWQHFIRSLPDSMSVAQMSVLDSVFAFSANRNPEVQCIWYVKSVRNRYAAANPEIKSFLIKVGRRKFLEPIYKELVKTEEGKKFALEVYKEARSHYHPIAVHTMDVILGYQNHEPS